VAPWSVADIPDQHGRFAVVTGANSGIGYPTARELAGAGARVVLACRDEGRGSDALRRLKAQVTDADAGLSLLDLSDLSSIRRFASDLVTAGRPIDVLVNNAGVMGVPTRRTTNQGFELQFGTNHLGHFALTGLLLPLFVERAGARVVTVSSGNHWAGRIHFDDLHGERSYRPYRAYNESKLANVLFFRELDRRLRARGSPAISVGAHPGYTETNLQQAGPRMGSVPLQARALGVLTRVVGQDAEMGALPSLYAATAQGVQGGQYFGPAYLEFRGPPRRALVSPRGKNDAAARRLWEESEKETGVTYRI
jgi:NAD(P)-dependent dehydrogenase (short-subunit alcohol dehydrogenase family)